MTTEELINSRIKIKSAVMPMGISNRTAVAQARCIANYFSFKLKHSLLRTCDLVIQTNTGYYLRMVNYVDGHYIYQIVPK